MGIFFDTDRIRILLLIDSMGIGGAETHLLTLAKALIQKGAEVEVMCDTGAYTQLLEKIGARVFLTPFRDRSLRGFFRCARALRKKREENYTAVHAHTRYTAALAAQFLPRHVLVTTVHLNFSLTLFQRVMSRWGRRALAVSEDLAEYLTEEYGVKRENILLTKNGIDTKDFSFLPVRGKSVLHLSRLDKDRSRCAHALCAIAPRLHERAPDIKILIYGDGNDSLSVRAAADAANAAIGKKTVFLKGSTRNVSAILPEGALLVGVSRAALEGAAAGLPIVLAGNDGYGGILTEETFEKRKNDNFCCRKCEKIDENRLLLDIIFLWENKEYCENLRGKIAALLHRDFSAQSMAEDALRAYRAAQRTALVGFYGYGNFGDEMMLCSIQRQLFLHGTEQVSVLSAQNEKGNLSRRHPLRSLLFLRKCDTVLFGGGNLLQSETSMRSLFYYALLLLFCRKDACEGIGMGIGGFGEKKAQWLCARLLPRFRRLSFRTRTDVETALRLAPSLSGRIYLTCDPCLHLPEKKDRHRGHTLLVIPRRKPEEATLSLLRGSLSKGGARLAVLFPKEDATHTMQLAKQLGIEVRFIQTQGDFFLSAEEASISVSERLHGAVFSLLCHLPCLLYCKSDKNRAFADDCASVAARLGFPCPILPFTTYEEAMLRKKEAEGCTLGFSEIIQFLRTRYVRF